jgi:predicted AAA+ superfamily ATPase
MVYPGTKTFVFQEARRQATAQDIPASFLHFRDKDNAYVDIVLEQGARAVAAIEVKASSTVTAFDFRGIGKLKTAVPRKKSVVVLVAPVLNLRRKLTKQFPESCVRA